MNGDRKGFADLAFYFHTDDVSDMMAVSFKFRLSKTDYIEFTEAGGIATVGGITDRLHWK